MYDSLVFFFFGGGQGSNPRPYIFYALSILTELSSRGQLTDFSNWCNIAQNKNY